VANKVIIGVVVLAVAVGALLYAPVGPSFGDAAEAVTEDETTYTHDSDDSFVVNEISYSVTGTDTAERVGSGVVSQDAEGVFLLVEVRLESVGGEVNTVSSSPITLVDAGGNEYEVSSAEAHVRDSLNAQQLQPGETITGVVIFDVPRNAGELRLKVESTDMASGGEVHYVELGGL